MAQCASSQILAGSAAELQSIYGAEWVRRWARTLNFGRWVADNSLATAARLWRARLEASAQEEARAPAAAERGRELRERAAAGSKVQEVLKATEKAKGQALSFGRGASSWFKQKVQGRAAEEATSKAAADAKAALGLEASPSFSADESEVEFESERSGGRRGSVPEADAVPTPPPPEAAAPSEAAGGLGLAPPAGGLASAGGEDGAVGGGLGDGAEGGGDGGQLEAAPPPAGAAAAAAPSEAASAASKARSNSDFFGARVDGLAHGAGVLYLGF